MAVSEGESMVVTLLEPIPDGVEYFILSTWDLSEPTAKAVELYLTDLGHPLGTKSAALTVESHERCIMASRLVLQLCTGQIGMLSLEEIKLTQAGSEEVVIRQFVRFAAQGGTQRMMRTTWYNPLLQFVPACLEVEEPKETSAPPDSIKEKEDAPHCQFCKMPAINCDCGF